MPLHHIRPITFGLAVIIVPSCKERLVITSELAVTVIVSGVPYHTVPCPYQHILRQLVHTKIKIHVQIVSYQIWQVEILVRFFLESATRPLGFRKFTICILIIHAFKQMCFLVICEILSCFCFLHTTINEAHHTIDSLVHLVVLVTGAEVVFQIGFFGLITSSIRPKSVFRVVKLQSSIEVVVHKVCMVGFRTRQPLEQATGVGVVQCFKADWKVLLMPLFIGFEIIQCVALSPCFLAYGLVLPEYRITIALLIVGVVLPVIGQIIIHRFRNKEVARHTVYSRADVVRNSVILCIPLCRSKKPHFL